MLDFNQMSTQTRLTLLIWRRRLKFALPIAALLGLVVAAAAVWSFDPWIRTATREGTVVGLRYHVAKGTARPPNLTVELDGGAVVKVSHTEHLRYANGRRMVVQEHVSRILGRQRYSFVRLLE